MIAGVVSAVVACLAHGVSSVSQAYGARRSVARAHAQHRAETLIATGAPTLASTVAAALTAWLILGTADDAIGFVGGATAARLVPLFLSHTIPSANLIVTAVITSATVQDRPGGRTILERLAARFPSVALVWAASRLATPTTSPPPGPTTP